MKRSIQSVLLHDGAATRMLATWITWCDWAD